jgi:hypothetical protein
MQSEILSGWKDIANYLGRGVRTVQRYERELSLPVRRPAGKSKGSVIARQSELDTWVASSRLTDSQLPAASVLSGFTSLKNLISEMDDLAERVKRLRLEISAHREMLRESVRRIQREVNPEHAEYRRLSGLRFPGRR